LIALNFDSFSLLTVIITVILDKQVIITVILKTVIQLAHSLIFFERFERLIMSKKYSELSFKFKYINKHNVQGLFAQKGLANEEAITLGKERLIYEDIADTTTRDNRLILAISPTASLSQKVSKQLMLVPK
jgi:disulfide oxidoreductase YuzD